jgi:hypothetical protein
VLESLAAGRPLRRVVRLRLLEVVVAALALLVVVVLLLAGEWVAAVVFAALVVFVLAQRAQVLEREVAGSFARTRGRLELVQTGALFAIYLVICGFFVVINRDHWTRDRHGTVAMWALAGLAFLLLRELQEHGDAALNWIFGGRAEERVGAELDLLRAQGWFVAHNLKMEYGGNLDHLAIGKPGAFAVETKSGKYRSSDRAQALRAAVWAKQKFGQRWVTAVLCVCTDPPQQPEQHGKLWVLGPEQLRPWLLAQRPWQPQRVPQ